MDIEDTMLDVEATLCYLCSGGGCDSAMAAKYCMVRGKCVCSAMLHGSETWGPTLLTCSAGPPQWPYNDPLDQWHQKRRLNTLSFATTKTWHWGYYSSLSQSAAQMACRSTACHVLYQISFSNRPFYSLELEGEEGQKNMSWICEDWC